MVTCRRSRRTAGRWNGRSDIFSLRVVMYEALSGRHANLVCTRSGSSEPAKEGERGTRRGTEGRAGCSPSREHTPPIDAADHGRRGDLRSRQHQPSLVTAGTELRLASERADGESESADAIARLRGVLSAPGLRDPRTFPRGGESAKTIDRSQLQSLLTYCRLNKGRVSSCST